MNDLVLWGFSQTTEVVLRRGADLPEKQWMSRKQRWISQNHRRREYPMSEQPQDAHESQSQPSSYRKCNTNSLRAAQMSRNGNNNNIVQVISPCDLYSKWHKAYADKVEITQADLQWLVTLERSGHLGILKRALMGWRSARGGSPSPSSMAVIPRDQASQRASYVDSNCCSHAMTCNNHWSRYYIHLNRCIQGCLV